MFSDSHYFREFKQIELKKAKSIAVIDHVGVKGGMHEYSLGLLEALAEKGVKTYYLSNLPNSSSYKSNIKKVFSSKMHKNVSGFLSLLNALAVSVLFLRKKKVKWVVFHLFESTFLIVSMLAFIRLWGFKVIGIVHDVEGFDHDSEVRGLQSFIYRKLLFKVVVHNAFSKRLLLQNAPFLNEEKVMIARHGNFHLNTNSKMNRFQAAQFLGLDSNFRYVLFFGQIKTVKGLDLLLEAFPNNMPQLKLIVAGRPWKDDFSTYKTIIEKRKLQPQFVPMIRYIKEEERQALFALAELIVLPYRKIFQSGVLLHAVNNLLAVVASDLEANVENLAHGEGGFLFKSEDVLSLKNTIVDALESKEEREEKARLAFEFINKEYDWRTISKAYLQLIE
tara:strand:- start:170 stop:1342 length:1173 start_codon:yes stop_codon:yes gene_type:complete